MSGNLKNINYFKSYVDYSINMVSKGLLNTTGVDEELFIRNILSRAYYTCFLHCRNILEMDSNKKRSVHQDVMEAINNEDIRDRLSKLLSDRGKADYDNIFQSKNVAYLSSVQREMNYILKRTKADLLKKN